MNRNIILVVIAVVILLVGGYFVFFWPAQNTGVPGNGATSTNATGNVGGNTNTNDNTSGTTGGVKPVSGSAYSSIKYGYTISYLKTAPYNISTPENVSFGATTTSNLQGTLTINVMGDNSSNNFCLTKPTTATSVATTTFDGVPFLTYTGPAPTGNLGTAVYYKTLRKIPAGTTACYSIIKYAHGSTAIDLQLNALLSTLRFN